MNHKFEAKGDHLFIDGHKVIKGFESFSGWYWFAFEVDRIQDSDMGNGQVILQDKIYFGLVQGHEEELGYFSEGEILALGEAKVWEIPKKALPYAGRRNG
jgi:hypothetical protein